MDLREADLLSIGTIGFDPISPIRAPRSLARDQKIDRASTSARRESAVDNAAPAEKWTTARPH
jgi:hypothetical protein